MLLKPPWQLLRDLDRLFTSGKRGMLHGTLTKLDPSRMAYSQHLPPVKGRWTGTGLLVEGRILGRAYQDRRLLETGVETLPTSKARGSAVPSSGSPQ